MTTTKPVKQRVALCRACLVYVGPEEAGQRCPVIDCEHRLRLRLGYICRRCETNCAESSLWFDELEFRAHLYEDHEVEVLDV